MADTLPQDIHPNYFGYTESRALSVNAAGQVVGYAISSRDKSFLQPSTDPNVVYCVAAPGAETTARDINEDSLMVGSSTDYSVSPVRTKPVTCTIDGDVTVLPLTGDVVAAMAITLTNRMCLATGGISTTGRAPWCGRSIPSGEEVAALLARVDGKGRRGAT